MCKFVSTPKVKGALTHILKLKMITEVKGDVFDSGCAALVNPVNCVGVMGAGLALQFKHKFPKNFDFYKSICRCNALFPGIPLIFEEKGVFVINFPTKSNWKEDSKLYYIERGMPLLVNLIVALNIPSVAIPKLGCGLGNLDWEDVKPLVYQAFEAHPSIDVMLYT